MSRKTTKTVTIESGLYSLCTNQVATLAEEYCGLTRPITGSSSLTITFIDHAAGDETLSAAANAKGFNKALECFRLPAKQP